VRCEENISNQESRERKFKEVNKVIEDSNSQEAVSIKSNNEIMIQLLEAVVEITLNDLQKVA
jgi:hypothetical protein